MENVEIRKEYYPDGELWEESEFVDGIRHGKCTVYYKSGARRSVETFAKGMREGEAQIFYESGAVRWRTMFHRGFAVGKEYNYHENGQLRKVTEYDDGRVVDSEIPVFDENGQQLITEKWKDGYCRVFFKDGSILCEGFFINRDRVGLHKFYFRDGGVQIEEYYRRGVQHGLSRVYNKNGSLKSETQYVDGVREGIAKYYDHKKGIICEYPFHNNELNGVAHSYCDGRLFVEETYENGVRQGYAQYFDSKGKVYKKSMYVDDEYCGSKRLEYEGDVLTRECDMVYERPEGEEVSYNDNGKFRMRVWYKNGMVVDGKYEFFEGDGSLGGHVEFRNNRAIESDAEGHLRVACDFYRDEWNGRCVFYGAEEGESECYFMGDDMYETREEFLDATFEHMAGICLARFARRHPEYSEETYKAFFAEAYEKAMNSPAAQVEYNDYAELENPGSEGIPDARFVDYLVREFVLRLRLPNDGETEREIVKGLNELVGR